MSIHNFNNVRSIQIQTIDYCNRKCSFCPNKDFNKTPDQLMTEKIFLKILADLKELNYGNSIHPYLMAEPLCDKRFKDLVRITRQKFPSNDIMISTNGDFLKNRNDILELCKAGLSRIVINLYDEETNHLKIDAREIEGIKLRTLAHLKAKEFWNRGGLVDVPSAVPKRTICYYALKKMCINYLGDVILCCSDYHYEVIYGNIMQTSLIDIWNNKKYRYFREMHASGNGKKLPVCKRCNRII